MAEIDIERRPEKKTPWGWLLAALLVVVLAAAAFLFFTDSGRDMMGRGEMEMEPDREEMMTPPGNETPPPEGAEPR